VRFARGLVATASAGVLLSQAVGVAQAADNPFEQYSHQALTWGPCTFTLPPTYKAIECAAVTVPRDWAHPDSGVDLKVNFSRVKSTGQHAGAILVNPGGPGGQGTPLASQLATLQPSVNQIYDFIGMDPRGTGFAGSAAQGPLVCNVPVGRLSTRTDLDARDRSATSIAEHQKAPRAIAEACQSDANAPYITTWQTAYDMELMRILLGESTLNYVGYSYGSWLGAKYTSLFPASAGKVVLDSSVNWQGRLQADFEYFPVTDQRQLDDVFLPWISRQFPDLVGATPEAAKQTWEDVRNYYKSLGYAGDDYDGVFVGNGNSGSWLNAALVIIEGVQGIRGGAAQAARSADLQAQLDAQAMAEFGVPAAQVTAQQIGKALLASDYVRISLTRVGVACGDQPTKSAAWYKALSDRQGPQYPLFGWQYGIGEFCGFWSDAPQQTLPTLPASAAGKVLVVQGEFDPQTAYEQANAAVRAAPGVTMVSVDDAAFHGQYAISGNPCVDGMVNVFLLRNSRPGNATCPGVPLPGETQVYPVAGPVRQHFAARSDAVAPRQSALAKDVQNEIGRINSVK
jgi:pimeloyl-ACP methyl ester carboxylesterase